MLNPCCTQPGLPRFGGTLRRLPSPGCHVPRSRILGAIRRSTAQPFGILATDAETMPTHGRAGQPTGSTSGACARICAPVSSGSKSDVLR